MSRRIQPFHVHQHMSTPTWWWWWLISIYFIQCEIIKLQYLSSLYWISRVWTYWCEQSINPLHPYHAMTNKYERKRKESETRHSFFFIHRCVCEWNIKVSIPIDDNLHLLSVYSLNEKKRRILDMKTETSWNHENYFYQGFIFNQYSVYFSYNEFILDRTNDIFVTLER